MINALQSISNLDRNSLHASVRQCAPPDLIFSFSLLAVYLKVLMIECLHFSHPTGSRGATSS